MIYHPHNFLNPKDINSPLHKIVLDFTSFFYAKSKPVISDSLFSIPNYFLKNYGLENSAVITNLINHTVIDISETMKNYDDYFFVINDDWFPITNKEQSENINISIRRINTSIRFFESCKALQTTRKGYPSFRHYKINFNILASHIKEV